MKHGSAASVADRPFQEDFEENEPLAPNGEEGFEPALREVPPRASRMAEEPDESGAPTRDPRMIAIKEEWKRCLLERLSEVNKELWLVLSILIIAGVANYAVASDRIVLGFYALPTLFSAYCCGRRHAILTALASVLLIVFLAQTNPRLFRSDAASLLVDARWYDLAAWGGILILTAIAMGTLHERQKARLQELHQTYRGLLLILRQFVAKDKFTENHCYRVSVYAARIAATMNLSSERIEAVRAASLIHDIGKLDTSRDLLYKAARLTEREFHEIKKHAARGAAMLEPVGGPLHRIIPIILAHHEKYDGSGYNALKRDSIPLEARIIAVADAYDSLTSDRPYRKAIPPFQAKEVITNSAGTHFDPEVVEAFAEAFSRGEMEIPELVL